MSSASTIPSARPGFADIYSSFWPRVVGYVFRHVANRSDAEDIAADVFLRAFEAYPRFEPRPTAAPWLFTIARHACSDYRRKQAMRERLTQALAWRAESQDPLDIVERRAVWRHLQAEAARLPKRQQQALRCFHGDGLSWRETARLLGCSEDAAKMLCHRGVRALRASVRLAA